jgi:predicted transcriptional regulator
VTVHPDTKMSEALDIMAEKDIRHIPVVDKDNKVVGYLTWKNLFRHFSSLMKSQGS